MNVPMKPRVSSHVHTLITPPAGKRERHWHVEFTDSCGCAYEEIFPDHSTALRFARHVAQGGSRWEFVE